MPSGRPKIKLTDLPDGWEEKVLTLAEKGASDVELRVQALGGICHETWTRLIKEEPSFSETIKRAKDLCKVWWEAQGRTNLKDRDFSPTLWYMNMKNRFGWRDKQDITTDNKPISVNITSYGGDSPK